MSFPEGYVKRFWKELETTLARAAKKNQEDYSRYFSHEEENLIKRIHKYGNNYFAWLTDFTLPATNNLSERALRGVKSHMKISGQFDSVKTARYYAMIRSYIETCRRNGINEIAALGRLAEGNPYTVEEIIK